MAADRIVKFYVRVGPRSIGLADDKLSPVGRGQGHVMS